MKRLISLVLLLTVVLTLAACGKSDSGASGKYSISDEPVQYPITVTDHSGREVIIEEKPERLVSGYYISTSAVIALDLDEKLVGIEAKADKRAIYKLSAPELISLPSVGTAKEFDLEGCAALEPDLVILPIKLKSAVETLESLGIDVLLVNPENSAQLCEMIIMMADAADARTSAKKLLDFIADTEAELAKKLEKADKPSVYLAGNSNMLSTAGDMMYQSDMIKLAGGTNVASEITDTYWAEIDYEQLLLWNPDYIIMASDADYTVDDVLADPNLASLKAVTSKNVYQLPDKAEAWDSPVPSGILGSVWLSGVLHPDLFEAEYINNLIDEYYAEFYGFTYSEK